MSLVKFALFGLALSILAPAASAGNGVERGDISSSTELGIPKPIQSYVQHIFFENCAVKNLESIKPSFVYQESQNEESPAPTTYYLEYIAKFVGNRAPVTINIQIEFFPEAQNGVSLKLIELSSEICTYYSATETKKFSELGQQGQSSSWESKQN